MTDERWRRVKALFEAAVERPTEERNAFLAAATSDDDALRREVESLLASDNSDASFLDRLPAANEPMLAGPLAAALALMDHTPPHTVLTPGLRVGPYEIVGPLGRGAMGEVYRACDTKLNREVALKLLPELFARDPDRLARFTREAQLLATLNHPNIAAIYRLEESSGAQALVLELVDGPTLADRIALGPIPLEEALTIARQIAEALEAAHEQRVIHRDLKPANIKLRPDGTVKVLDFGLAKALAGAGRGAEDHTLTFQTQAMTQAGMILGTPAYMSPEQAKGRPADTRADIWAFGVVVFEMLAGQRLFTGETISDTLASVLRTDPNWHALPAAVPPSLRRLLRSCLKKDPKRRLQAIGDARVPIEDLLNGVPDDTVATRPAVPRRRMIAAASVVFAAGAVIAVLCTWTLTRPAPAKLQPARFAIVPPAARPLTMSGFYRDLAISPDGRQVVYASGAPGESRLMVRAIDQLDAVPLGGSTGASAPFFSPDGRWIGFFSGAVGGELKKVSITGGPPVSLGRTRGNSGGASWGPDDTIVFATRPPTGMGLLRVPATGGEPTVLTTPDAAHGEVSHLFPSVLPGGRAILFTITAYRPTEDAQVAVLDLTTGQRKTLIRGGSQAEYVEPGYLVYAVPGTLQGVRFDPVKLEVLSDPVPVVESVSTLSNGTAEFSVSRQGALVYVPGASAEAARSLVWVDRRGREEPIAAPPRAYAMLRLSPDGTRVAVSIGSDQDLDIWIWDFARQTLTRLTDAPGFDWHPVWTPDSRRILFSSERARSGITNLFWQATDNTGTVERLTTSPNRQGPTSVSPDGTRLIVQENTPKTGWDLRVLRLDGLSRSSGATASRPLANGSGPTEPLVQTTAAELDGQLSPDGHWLAYQSDESGHNQIFVRPFPNVDGGHWQISTNGGITPVWARNGKELFYLDGTNAVIRVPIESAPTFSAGPPAKLFEGRYVGSPFWRTYDVSPDGQRLLMIKANAAHDQTSMPASMVVVLNWFEELKQRVPASGK